MELNDAAGASAPHTLDVVDLGPMADTYQADWYRKIEQRDGLEYPYNQFFAYLMSNAGLPFEIPSGQVLILTEIHPDHMARLCTSTISLDSGTQEVFPCFSCLSANSDVYSKELERLNNERYAGGLRAYFNHVAQGHHIVINPSQSGNVEYDLTEASKNIRRIKISPKEGQTISITAYERKRQQPS